MRTLITGASGFTGLALTKKLNENGEAVRVLVRNKAKFQKLYKVSSHIEIFEGDICDKNFINKAVKNIDVIFHIAAAYRDASLSKDEYWKVNVISTENLLEASRKNNVGCFVYCSSVGVHGHIESPPADENYQINPQDTYQITKVEGERRVNQYYNKYKLPVTIIRPTAIYGPGDLRLLKLFKLVRKRITLVIGSGNNFYHMVYIQDLIDAFIKASQQKNAIGESFIIGGNEIYTLNNILDMIEKIYNRNNFRIHFPMSSSLMMAKICEFFFPLFNLNPPLYKRRVNFFVKTDVPSLISLNKCYNIL